MERYVTTTYCLLEIQICAWGWYVTTTYHSNKINENNVINVYDVFSLEFLVCWGQACYVLRFRERLSTSLADVLEQGGVDKFVRLGSSKGCSFCNEGFLFEHMVSTFYTDVHTKNHLGTKLLYCWIGVCLIAFKRVVFDQSLIIESQHSRCLSRTICLYKFITLGTWSLTLIAKKLCQIEKKITKRYQIVMIFEDKQTICSTQLTFWFLQPLSQSTVEAFIIKSNIQNL